MTTAPKTRAPDAAVQGLAALEARLRHDLAMIDTGERNQVTPRQHPSGAPVHDVAIVGGGQSGLGAAFALRRAGVGNLVILDENAAGREGPWITYARMITLRTPKFLVSIDMGVPSLTFRAWYEAQHGAAAWEALGKIPRGDWMDYLRWYRRVLDLPVVNGAKVTAVVREGELFRIAAGKRDVLARKVVFATGQQGGGEPRVPKFIKDHLDRRFYSHTSDDIDFAALKGKRLGLLGAGASAFDNAQHALGLGAASADLFVRRPETPKVNLVREMERSGLIDHYADLDDAAKYATAASYFRRAMPPTLDTMGRASAYPGFKLHLGTPWTAARQDGEQVVVATPKGEFVFDHLILSTGMAVDLSRRPELAAFHHDIALWGHKHEARPAAPEVDAFPYLGPGFEFTGRTKAAARRLHGLFAFNYAAFVSQGLSAGALSGLRVALPKLAAAVRSQLFLDDRDAVLQSFHDYDEPEPEA